jgi:hypothetical protein
MYSIPANSFWQWVQSMPHPEAIIMPIFFIVLTAIVTGGIVINSIHRRRTEANLKRELLDRGMSADEIATVIGANSSRGGCGMHSRQATSGEKHAINA